MRAAFLTGPRTLELRTVPEPTVPADGLVLAVQSCGVCGSDVRRWREGPAQDAAPLVPGHEVAGIVTAVGAHAERFEVGDRLALAPDVHCGRCYYCQRGLYNLCDDLRLVGITAGYPGGFAQSMAVPGDVLRNGVVHRMPEGLSFLDASLSEPLASVLATHDRAGTTLGDLVVVIGAGPTGCMHIAVAKARGARVVVSQRSATRREQARRFDPDLIVDSTQGDLVAAVRDLSDGVGADAVICANPVASTQALAVDLVRKRGKVILFGGLPKADPITHLDGNRIHYGEIEVIGAFSYHPTKHAQALDAIARGIVRAEQIVTHRFLLEQAQSALETAASGAGLKVVLEPQLQAG